MAWGSNITNVDFSVPQTDFDAQGWNNLVKEKRGRDYTMKVAEARKGVREKFTQDRENKAYTAEKERLSTELKTVSDRIKEIETEMRPIDEQIRQLSGALNQPNDITAQYQNRIAQAGGLQQQVTAPVSKQIAPPIGQNTINEDSMVGYSTTPSFNTRTDFTGYGKTMPQTTIPDGYNPTNEVPMFGYKPYYADYGQNIPVVPTKQGKR